MLERNRGGRKNVLIKQIGIEVFNGLLINERGRGREEEEKSKSLLSPLGCCCSLYLDQHVGGGWSNSV